MQNFKYFWPAMRDRLRFVDWVRFLFHGRAFKRRFAARAAQQGIIFSSKPPSHRLLYATAGAAMLLLVGWLGAQLREARVRNQSMAAELRALRQTGGRPQTAPLQSQPTQPHPRPTAPAPAVQIVRENPNQSGLSESESPAPWELEQARADLERARAGSRRLDEQLKQAHDQIDSLRSEIAGSRSAEARLSDQLRESEVRLSGMAPELTRLQAGHSQDTEIIASQKLRLRELTDRVNAKSDALDNERKLLVADLDIRELMGARSLHIVDVFDVDGKGKTQRPFGRVFYTEGKSLIFYAFDLKGGDTFQAWGQREARAESAQSLGIFYVDDKKQNRWVLKFEDPKVLAEINAVFVTVEPPGGSVKPNRQKMLYAYLNATPNHP